jgi:5-deoxy-glucuronate isomerase
MTSVIVSENLHFEHLSKDWGHNGLTANPCKLLDFSLLRLQNGQITEGNSGEQEILAVILGGKCAATSGDQRYEKIGARPNVFSGKPYGVYIPPETDYSFTGIGNVEIAFCMAARKPDQASSAPFLITPEQVSGGVWGAANFSRNFHGVLVETEQPIHRLIVGETFTPSGNWSTYPPHKHEQEVPGKEVYMEEIYYFRVDAPDGFGLLKHYTDDKSIDTVYTVRDNSICKLERGYHTYVSAPGYTGYYLWFLAGEHRNQNAAVDPGLAWVGKAVPMLRQAGG